MFIADGLISISLYGSNQALTICVDFPTRKNILSEKGIQKFELFLPFCLTLFKRNIKRKKKIAASWVKNIKFIKNSNQIQDGAWEAI